MKNTDLFLNALKAGECIEEKMKGINYGGRGCVIYPAERRWIFHTKAGYFLTRARRHDAFRNL